MSEKMILSSDLSMKIDKIIDQLRQKIHPICIVLADISGQLLSTYNANKEIDVTGLAALFASNMGATGAIAEKIYETSGFDFIMQEGKDYNVFLSKIKNSYILAIVFSRSHQMGMVRLFTKKACNELLELTEEYEIQNQTAIKKGVGDNFSSILSKQLTHILENSGII